MKREEGDKGQVANTRATKQPISFPETTIPLCCWVGVGVWGCVGGCECVGVGVGGWVGGNVAVGGWVVIVVSLCQHPPAGRPLRTN